jgi:multiple sugar transport system ATP-binding protein
VLRRSGTGAQIELGNGSRVGAPPNVGGADGQPITYGVRPEHLAMCGEAEGFAADVVVVEPTGADTQVFSKVDGVELTAIFRERHDFRPGQRIALMPDVPRTFVFDSATGKRLVG